MLLHFGIVPYLVFDGDYLPSKSATEAERAAKREESRKLGLELHRLGKISQSQNEFLKAVDVTPEMARQLIEELKKHGVQYVVAPYEADAQLAYLERKGIITGILSEDSDLLVFGAKCLLTKLDQYGDCVEINRDDFAACREISLVGWSDSEFRLMAILSGCDYLTNIDKMGLKTAYRHVRKYKNIEKILRMLAFDGKFHVPPDYLESFRKAEMTFLHQRVFCPILNDMVMMTSLGTRPEPEDFAFVGGRVAKEIAIGVARGDLNPMTKQPMVIQDKLRRTPKTPGSSYFQPQSGVKISDLKGNKSIELFFKARRTPLAELDPNSFTPSPSQQRLLENANTTWLSDFAPTTPLLTLQPGVLRTDRSAALSGPTRSGINVSRVGQSQSIPNSSKRRRLCLEVEEDGGDIQDQSRNEELGSSRFFSSFPNPSPSVNLKPSKKRGKPTEINIWSDDSIEDVMAGLPDLSECHDPKKEGKLKVFRDESPKADTALSFEVSHDDGSVREDSQSSAISKATTESNSSVGTTSTWCSKPSQSVANSLDGDVSAELTALRRFSYKPESEGPPLSSRPCDPESKRPNAPSLINVMAKPKCDRRRSMTPLERLGAGALSRSNSRTNLINITFESSSSSSTTATTKRTATTTKTTPESIQPGRDRAENPLKPLSSNVAAACQKRGSEDQIIPDSEDESDSDSAPSSEVDPLSQLKTKPDFARFIYIRSIA